MKTISFKQISLLIAVSAAAAAFKNTRVHMLPETGWYQTINSFLAPGIPAMPTLPLGDPVYNASRFESSATAYGDLTCGSLSLKVCAAYFRSVDDMNIPSPSAEENVYFLAGGRP